MLGRVIAFVIPLGFDTFAIAVALGLRRVEPLRPAVVFAIFETTMPIVGIVAGRLVGERFVGPAEIFGGLLLIGVGIHALLESFENDVELKNLSFGSWSAAALAGVAISMDELAVGFPLGAARLPIATVLLAIGIQAFLVSAVGIMIGARIGASLGRAASRCARIVAAIAFSAVGIWLILEAVRP